MAKIHIGKKTMINPFYLNNTIFKYEGDFDEKLFLDNTQDSYRFLKTQTKNYLKLKNYLETKGLFFITISIGVYPRAIGHSISFIAKTNINNDDEEILWKKYGSKCVGGDQNHIYYRNKDDVEKINTSHIQET